MISSAEDTAQRVAVVTGASSGIGLHTALGLARSGMRVVMTGRDRARTEQARRWVIERSGSDRVDMVLADFSRLAEVRWFERDEVRDMVERSRSDDPVPGLATLPPPLAIGHQIARRWAFGVDSV